MTVVVLANPAAGALAASRDEDETARITAAFRAAGVDAEVRHVRGAMLTSAARDAAAAGVDAVVAAGGDGTISAVAGALTGGAVPLGVLPMGTLNHFARDLQIPLPLEDAVRVIAGGFAREVDVGEVNGRVFINNSSIGLYPRVVRHRDKVRQLLGRPKWIAMLYAVLSALRRWPLLEVRLAADEKVVSRDTPFVFVGNNHYELQLFSMGQRRSIDRAELCLYVSRRPGRFALLRLALLWLIGRLEQSRDFDSLYAARLSITTRKRHLAVALDGEVAYLRPPLEYRTRPKALRVLTPRDIAEVHALL